MLLLIDKMLLLIDKMLLLFQHLLTSSDFYSWILYCCHYHIVADLSIGPVHVYMNQTSVDFVSE